MNLFHIDKARTQSASTYWAESFAQGEVGRRPMVSACKMGPHGDVGEVVPLAHFDVNDQQEDFIEQ